MSEVSGPVDPAADDHVIRCRVTGADANALRAFVEETAADLGCRPLAVRAGDRVATYLMISRSDLSAARGSRAAADVVIEELADLTAEQAAAANEVGEGDRYATRGTVPRGVGRKE